MAAVAAVVARPAITPVTSPAVVAIPDTGNLIEIFPFVEGSGNILVNFPLATSPKIVGSSLSKLKEFTPSTLQSTAWIDAVCTDSPALRLGGDLPTETLEDYLLRNMRLLPSYSESIADVYLTATVNIFVNNAYNPASASLQFDTIRDTTANGGS